MIRVVVSGAAGRMGRTVCEAVEGADDMALAGRVDPSLDTPLAGALHAADVVVDFSTPASAPENVRECLTAGVHAVVGTTGFNLEELRKAADEAAAAADRGCSWRPTSRSAPSS